MFAKAGNEGKLSGNRAVSLDRKHVCPVSARGRTLTLQIHVVLIPLRKPRTYHHACRTDSDCPRSDGWLESRPTSCVN